MKRKGARRSGKSEDDNVQTEDEPQEKRGRKSGKSRASEPLQSDDESPSPSTSNGSPDKKGRRSGRQSSPKKTRDEAEDLSSDDEVLATKVSQNGNTSEKKKNKEKKSKGRPKGKKAEVAEDEESTPEKDPLADDDEEEDDGPEYEVEKIIDKKITKGVTSYLIRWKGYGQDSDTWEPESTLDCAELIDEFKKKEKSKSKKDNNKTGKKKKSSKKDDEPEESWDENEDFEVDRIIDVYFHKNGKKDFLVSWKGYGSSANSWEPEDNMDCKDLISKFMEKVDKAKQFESKESRLRENPRKVSRLTIEMHSSERKLSRRHRGQGGRRHYFDAE